MPNITRRSLLAASTLLPFAPPLRAASKSFSIVVPYAAGGGSDTLTRLLAEGMRETLGVPVIVEYKGGANGIIGATHVSRARPDGTTLLWAGPGNTSLNIMLRRDLQFSFDSFDSVALLFDGPLSITVPTMMGVNTLDELIDYAKKVGRPLTYGSLGRGSVTDLYGLIMAQVLGMELTAIPYAGVANSMIDLVMHRNDLSYMTPIVMGEHMKAGTVKVLALTTETRHPALPDIPSVVELGYPKLLSSYWTGLLAPKGTPKDLIQEYAAAAIKTVQTERYRQLLIDYGQTEKAGGPQAMDAQLETDRQSWGKIIRDNNIVLE